MNSRKFFLLFSAVCVFMFQPAVYAQQSGVDALEESLIDNMAKGNDTACSGIVRQIISADPDSYEAEFYLRGALSVHIGDLYTSPQLVEFLTGLLQKGVKNEYNKSLINEYIAGELYSQDEYVRSMELRRSQGYIDRWLAIGWFGDYGESVFYEVLSPEKKISLDETYKAGDYEIKWHKTRTYNPGFRDVADKLERTGGTCFLAATYINSPSSRPAVFEIRARDAYKLFVNNAEAGRSDTFKEFEPLEKIHAVNLNAGWNLVMLKIMGRGGAGSMSVKLTDTEGRPFDDITAQIDGFEGDALPKIEKSAAKDPALRLRKDIFTHLREKRNKSQADYVRLTALLLQNNCLQESLKVAEEFRAAYPDSPYAAYTLGQTYEKMEYFLTEEKAQNKAKEMYEKSLQLAEGFVPALLGLAEFFSEKEKDKAMEYCRKVIALNPDNFRAHYMLKRIYEDKGWRPEELSEMRRMLELRPESEQVLGMWADYYDRLGNDGKAMELWAKIRTANGYKYDWSLRQQYTREGRLDDALAMLQYMTESFPEETYYINEMKEIYLKQGKFDKVEEMLAKMSALNPNEYQYRKELAVLYFRTGRQEKARQVCQEILAAPAYLGVFDTDMYEYLNFLDKRPDFARDLCERDLRKISGNAPGRKEYPDNPAIVLLEQNIIEIYGDDFKAKKEYTNEVIKILNKEGGERYGQIYPGGRAIETRVLTPDGKMLEPDPVQEGYSIRLPKLDENSVIQRFYYTENNLRSSGHGVNMLAAAGNIRREKQPVLRYQFILIVPAKSADFTLRQLNLPAEYVKEEKAGRVIYKWDFAGLEDYHEEFLMPPQDEILPVIKAYEGNADHVFELKRTAGRVLDILVPDNVRDKAFELTKDARDDYEKICRLYEFIVTEIKSGYGNNASQTLILKEGSHYELFTVMLKAVGIKFYYVFARPREFFKIDWDVDPPGFSARMIYIPRAGDRENIWIYIDRFVPIGVIPVSLQGGEAMLVDGEANMRFTSLPDKQTAEKANRLETEIVLNEDGSAEFETRLNLVPETMANALTAFKENLNEKQIKLQMQAIISNFFPGCKVKDYTIPEFKIDVADMAISISGTTEKYATVKKKRLNFRPIAVPLPVTQLLRETVRKFPMRLPFELVISTTMSESISIKLPAGATCKLPQSESIYTRFGVYTLMFGQDGDTITVERYLSITPQDIPADKYKDFVEFAKKIEAAEKQSVNVYPANE